MSEQRTHKSAALDALYADLDSRHIAPFWAVDASAGHDEDRQVMDKKKALPFIWKYRADIEPPKIIPFAIVSLVLCFWMFPRPDSLIKRVQNF